MFPLTVSRREAKLSSMSAQPSALVSLFTTVELRRLAALPSSMSMPAAPLPVTVKVVPSLSSILLPSTARMP